MTLEQLTKRRDALSAQIAQYQGRVLAAEQQLESLQQELPKGVTLDLLDQAIEQLSQKREQLLAQATADLLAAEKQLESIQGAQ